MTTTDLIGLLERFPSDAIVKTGGVNGFEVVGASLVYGDNGSSVHLFGETVISLDSGSPTDPTIGRP